MKKTTSAQTAGYCFEKPGLVPSPAKARWALDTCVELGPGLKVRLSCAEDFPAAADWLKRHLRDAFGFDCRIARGASAKTGEMAPEAYSLKARPAALEIAAHGVAGVRLAFFTLRQMAMPKRGTLKTEGWIVPGAEIEDAPAMAFRGMHLCWFPETQPLLIEHALRLAASYKFNHVVIETWGTFRSERHPWWGWPDGSMTKAELVRLRGIAADLGVTLVPQMNIFGHASMSRSKSGKHAALDLHPEYQPLFEPHHGWNWCLSNPAAHKVIDELVAEIHEAFGNPPFFHIGCDEADAPSCPACRARDYVKLIGDNIREVSALLEKRGARPMMWHDMLLKKGEWGRFYANAAHGEEKLLRRLPKQTVICDWFYNEGVAPEGYPTFAHFKRAGFDVVTSPWESWDGTAAQGKAARDLGLFGLLGTTWHHLYKMEMQRQFVACACAAWGDGEVDSRNFTDHWRQTGWDAGVADYADCGVVAEQNPSVTNPEIYPRG